MTPTVPRRRTYPPVRPTVELITPPLAPCKLLPAGRPGVVKIDGTTYALVYLTRRDEEGMGQIVGYRLLKGDGTVYDLPESLSECECRDSVYRSRPGSGCKHVASLRQLREEGRIA